MMGKKCCVPYCNTGNRKYKEKLPMYSVPKDDHFLNKWQEAIGRDDRPINTNDAVCQKHFIKDDFVCSRVVRGEIEEYKVPKLKQDAVPSVFPEIPEFIRGTVKKRRKLSVDAELFKKAYKSKTKDVVTHIDSNKGGLSYIKAEDNNDNNTQMNKQCDMKTSQEENNNRSAIGIFEVVLKEEVQIKEEDTDSMGSLNEEPLVEKVKEEIVGNGGKRPAIFKCSLCDYSTKWPHNLQTHQTKHLEGEEHYLKCEKCPKFKTKWMITFKNHMKTKHSEPFEIFKCTLCPYETKVKLCLKRHVEGVHKKNINNNNNASLNKNKSKGNSFNCAKCSFKTDSHKMLLNHFVTSRCYVYKEEDNVKFSCKGCNFECDTKDAFLRHTTSHKNESKN